MKRKFLTYSVLWALALGLFNLITFLLPAEVNTGKFSAGFWVGYVAISVAFIGQLFCALFALRVNERSRLFLQVPLFSISYTGLLLMLLAGGLCMLVAAVPYWVGILVCGCIFGFHVSAVIKAATTAGVIERMDKETAERRAFMAKLTQRTKALLAAAPEELQATVKQVYEALRCSDPVSNYATREIEGKMAVDHEALTDAVQNADAALAAATAKNFLARLAARNELCKSAKG